MSAYTLELASSLYPWGTGTPQALQGHGGSRKLCCINISEHFQTARCLRPAGRGDSCVTGCRSARALLQQWGSRGSLEIMTAQCTRWLSHGQLCLHYHVQPDWCHVQQENPAPPGATNPQVSSVSLKTKLFYSPHRIEQFLHKPSTSGASEEREGTLQHMCLFVWSAHCWVFY